MAEVRGKDELQQRVTFYKEKFDAFREEVSKVLVGQSALVDSLIEALISNGHVLLEGIPGIGKTLAIRAISTVTGASFSRIQFTPDLLPTDIIGITTYEEGKGFTTIKGPIFSNFVIADEINRSPPKVQAALLQGMQERQVTIGNETFELPSPFFVMATQNPLEHLGTYSLPEAQLDRFLYKCIVSYPSQDEEIQILERNMTLKGFSEFDLQKILDAEHILEIQEVAKQIKMSDKVRNYIIRVTDATRYPAKYDLETAQYINYGASPRASIGMFIAAKARALLNGRTYTKPQDVRDVAKKILRHRIDVNFEGQAEDVDSDAVVEEVLGKVKII